MHLCSVITRFPCMPRSIQGIQILTDWVDGAPFGGYLWRQPAFEISKSSRADFTSWTGSGEQHASVSVKVIFWKKKLITLVNKVLATWLKTMPSQISHLKTGVMSRSLRRGYLFHYLHKTVKPVVFPSFSNCTPILVASMARFSGKLLTYFLTWTTIERNK